MSFTDEEIARVAWEAARALADVLDPDAPVPPWSSVHPDHVADEVRLVKAARHGATPEAVHEQRMQLDPQMLPFDQLPPGDRAKDYLFTGICVAMNQAADIVTQAKNNALALEEAARMTADTSFNASLPFGGATPQVVELPQPQQPRLVTRDEGE